MNENQFEASVKLINQKVKFECAVEGKPPVIVDYVPPSGDGEGYTSLELLLVSLGSCFASTVKLILSVRLKKQVDDVNISISGIRKEEHPTSFKTISIKMDITAPELNAEELDKTIQMAKDSICPVWDMLRNNVEIITEYTLIPGQEGVLHGKEE